MWFLHSLKLNLNLQTPKSQSEEEYDESDCATVYPSSESIVQARIIGGTNAKSGEIPWHVAIYYDDVSILEQVIAILRHIILKITISAIPMRRQHHFKKKYTNRSSLSDQREQQRNVGNGSLQNLHRYRGYRFDR